MLKAFLSHSSLDKPVVREIKEKVQRLWTYFDEDCFEPGEDFRNAIVNRLSDTNLFVLFVSKSSLKSAWVKFEIDEAYWQIVQRDNISVLVLTLEDIAVTALPKWMRKAKFEQVRSSKQAAQLIKKLLFESASICRGLYMGRESDILKFNNELAQYEDKVPNIFVVTGLCGVGRRTFMTDILDKRFSLPYVSQFEMSETDGLIELYRKLLDENIEGMPDNKVADCYQWFRAASPEARTEEIARLLASYTKVRTCPVIIDNGAMLTDDGFYRKDLLCVLKNFSVNYIDCYLVLIHTRRPKLSYNDDGLLHFCRLNALDSSNCYSLFDALLKRQNVPTPDQAQVREIASYLEGYPPSILNAVKACAIEGVDMVCSDKRALVDFQERIFKNYLDKVPFTQEEWETLTALYNMDKISISPLSVILGRSDEDVAQSLKRPNDYNIVVLGMDGLYTIAPPMRVAIERKLPHYNKERFSKIASQLINKFWEVDPITSLPFSMIDTMIYAVLRSGQEDELLRFKQYVLPSHLLEAAKKANQDTEWAAAEKYARKALELDDSLMPAYTLLFKMLVRQETRQTRLKCTQEEDKILSILRTAHDKGVYYLEGFRYQKRHKYDQAIKLFRRAIHAGDSSIPTYRDLADCYYQTDNIREAQSVIENLTGKDTRKINNPFILDVASKIAISTGNFQRAMELLDKQELVDRFENVEHRWATYEMNRGDYHKALIHADNACGGKRVLPEMHLLRMSIAIHLRDWRIVEDEYKTIEKNYKHYPFDVREVLYTTMLLETQGWRDAEASFQRIHHPKSPFARSLRYKIVNQKLQDKFIMPVDRQELMEEKCQLESEKMLDALSQFQCYDLN